MRRQLTIFVALSVATLAAGCRPQQPFYTRGQGDMAHYRGVAQEIEYPDVNADHLDEVDKAAPPLTLDNPKPNETWELTLEQSVQLSLANSTVIRNLNGVAFGATGTQGIPQGLLQSPVLVPTTYLPALTEADPRTGVESALSAFDAQFSTSVFWERNDTPQNVGGFTSLFRPEVFLQDLASFQSQIAQVNPTGGQVAIRHNVRYEWNNTGTNSRAWPSEWGTNVEAEIRQPLLRGAGVQYNRIAGPGAQPGSFNGVMLARLRVDQSLAEFEGAVRNLASDVERAYWNLYYAYRRLDTVISGRNAALQTWRTVHAKYEIGARGGSAQEEAQARQQYFGFVATVEQAQANLYKTERMLRYMMGLAPTDGRLIYPSTDPTTAKVTFDWFEIYSEALVRSVELRRQKWRIKQAELELIASKNFLLPQLDGVARYRWLGLGDTLLDPDREIDPATGRLESSYASMTSGDFQEWHLGLDLRFPFGFRRELSGVRFAQLTLTRERKVLQEQELEVMHQLQDAINDLVLNYQLAQTYYDRRAAAQREVQAVEAAYEQGTVTLDLLLDAQRRLAEAEDQYHRSVVDYNLAITQVHFRKGSLLEYNEICLAEGPWPAKAYFDARRRAKHRAAGWQMDYGFTRPKVVSEGPYNQFMEPAGEYAQAGYDMPAQGRDELVPTPQAAPQAVPQPAPSVAPPRPPVMPPMPSVEPAPTPAPERSPSDATQGMWPTAPRGQPITKAAIAPQAVNPGWVNVGQPAARTSGVAPVGYQQTSPAPSGSNNSWMPQQKVRSGHEPVASPQAAAIDPSASGWQMLQHGVARPGM